MRIGFRTSPQKTDWASLEAAWAEAGLHDAFESGWLNDHLSDPGLERGGPSFEAMTWNYASNVSGSVEGFTERRDALRRACEAIERDPAELTISTQIIIPGDAVGRRTATERAIAYGRAGSDEILLTTPAREGAAGIRRLATEVAAPLRDAFG